mgnify:CR=1 FL=1
MKSKIMTRRTTSISRSSPATELLALRFFSTYTLWVAAVGRGREHGAQSQERSERPVGRRVITFAFMRPPPVFPVPSHDWGIAGKEV